MARSKKVTDGEAPAPKRKPGRPPRAKKAAETAAAEPAITEIETAPAPETEPAPKKTRAPRKRTKKAAATENVDELPLGQTEDEPANDAAPKPEKQERETFKPKPAAETESASMTDADISDASDANRAVAHDADESVSRTDSVSDVAAGDTSVAPADSQQTSDAPAPAEGSQPAQQNQQQGGDNGGGQQQPYESYWKRIKREKKEKKARKWAEQQSKHGQHASKHPQQPPPPSLNPVFGDLPAPDRFADVAALDTLAAEIADSASGHEPIYLEKLYALTLAELTAEARNRNAAFEGAPNRKQLIAAIFKVAAEQKIPLLDNGYIDLTDRGYGFIVHESVNYRLYPENAYLPESLVKRYGLKRGHRVQVLVQVPREGERCPSVVKVNSVMDMPPEEISKTVPFEELIPYYPLKRILLEAPGVHKDVSMRAVDILTPIGFGQRGLIVAPPRTGKTILLQNMANSISENFPDVKLILLLVDERPEEVTDFKRHTKGEVVASTFDEAPESHVHAAEMVGEKARRLVEQGRHVVILLDSITRLARAYNALASNSGKIMSGGMEATALQKPKRFFGAARNIEGGGSLTIMGTALVDTGSRMDEVIFEEFKGTGNMELHLDRGLVDKRIFPAINMDRSGTRKEELIYHPDEMLRIYGLRRAMQGIPPIDAMEMFLQRLKKTKTNAEFLMALNQ
ncbi:transcription termination factor Rho [Ereboglobus sp. PH5-5]|uniref:transcription termination factor Rho n=1 Tax=Ereboglobus sp. PH5-5 TaxID=2940529 RepID=UPI00240547AF|nr:transcription termination factor Rho [Ereboglobus sp. PH5-5]MDF9832215.1 transcription termination factor Rho [Ereboglobus sp. PH5-5]